MAKLLIANESLSKVDSKVKKELQEMFHGKQQKQQEKCLKTKANVIRKLLDSGASREDIKVVLDTLPDSIDDDHDDIQDAQHGTADTEKVSTTSNLEWRLGTVRETKSILPEPEPPPNLVDRVIDRVAYNLTQNSPLTHTQHTQHLQPEWSGLYKRHKNLKPRYHIVLNDTSMGEPTDW